MNLTLLDLSEARRKMMAQPGELTLQASPDEWANIFVGLKTASGKLVNREKALKVTAVLACVRILMEDISSLPLLLKKKTKTGAEDAVDHPLYQILKTAPNPLQTSVEVREHIVMDTLLTGRFACWQQRDKDGALQAIYPLRAQNLSFLGSRGTVDGNTPLLQWQYSSPELTRIFDQSDLWRGNIMSTSVVDGRSLIMLAREAIGLAIAAEEQGARLFSNGIQTDVVIKSEQELDDNARALLQSSLQRTYGGSSNAWRALLLEQGLDIEKIGLTAQESQYIEARNYQMQDIARVFRIPGVMLGIGDKTSTYASAEQFFLAYARQTITPWIVRIEQTIERDLLTTKENAKYFPKHQLAALLRSDQKTRFQTYQLGIISGFMSRNEARVAEDWDTQDGLDEFLMPSNSMPAGETDIENEAPDAAGTTENDQKTPENTPKPAKKPAKPAKGGQAQKLADCIANQVIHSETKWFVRYAKVPQTLEAANFRGWHHDRISKMTGASAAAVQEYSSWRMSAIYPLAVEVEAEARQRIINLCLEASCD